MNQIRMQRMIIEAEDAKTKGRARRGGTRTRTISLQTKRRTFIKDFSTHHASAPDMAKGSWNLEYEKHCVTDLIPLDAQQIPSSRLLLQTAPYCTLQNTQGNKHKHSKCKAGRQYIKQKLGFTKTLYLLVLKCSWERKTATPTPLATSALHNAAYH